MHLFRKILVCATLATVFFGTYRYYDYLTDDFRISNITISLPYKTEWETSKPGEEVSDILNQTFSYVGKGSQSYVFKSKDQKYVIKFFKFKHVKSGWFLNALPHIGPIATWQDYRDFRHQKKINRLLQGYKIAHDLIADESGLVYVHLNQIPPLNQTVTVFDKMGFERKIDLDHTVFVIQEAAETTEDILKEAIKKNDQDLINRRVNQLIAMYIREYQKGIYDKDHAIWRNTGFIGEQPIHIDVGNLVIDTSMKDPSIYQNDLDLVIHKINDWIKTQ
jgi:hypothetical protein